MKFSTRTDITAPVDFVFAQLSDFSAFERAALRRGAEVTRLDALGQPGAGMSWDIAFRMRGRRRQMIADVRHYEVPARLDYFAVSPSFEMLLTLNLGQISPGRCRLVIGLEVKPRSLPARLMVQSAKLGRKRLDRRFEDRVAKFAREIEDRARAAGVA